MSSARQRYQPPSRKFLSGYYKLSLHDPIEYPFAQGYSAGRGTSKLSATSEGDRGVNLLLVCPERRSNGVAVVHARISIHGQSGALMLFGVQDDRPVVYKVHDSLPVTTPGVQ